MLKLDNKQKITRQEKGHVYDVCVLNVWLHFLHVLVYSQPLTSAGGAEGHCSSAPGGGTAGLTNGSIHSQQPADCCVFVLKCKCHPSMEEADTPYFFLWVPLTAMLRLHLTPLSETSMQINTKLYWVMIFILWWNISVLMCVLSSRMRMAPSGGTGALMNVKLMCVILSIFLHFEYLFILNIHLLNNKL